MKNKCFTSYIQNKHILRAMGYVASILLIMIATSIFLPNYYPVTNTEAANKTANPSELTFTSTSSSATVSLDVTDENGSFAASSSNVAFAIRTNNATGYTLNLKSGNNTALVKDNSASSISSITSATTYSTFSGTSSASRALNNKWGILPSKYNGANNTNNYYPVSSTGFKMDETSAANTTANNYTIGLGIRANFDAATGTYANATLLVEYVANPVTYSINYNKNTTATVTDMPNPNPQGGTISQGTTATTVNLATAPSRTGYTFLGWCMGTSSSSNINTSNGVDTCSNASSNQFEAGQSFGINATGTSPDTYYFYAMWSANSYTCTKQYRLQNADGSWGEYQSDGTEQIKFDATCSYSKTVTNYKGSATATNNSTASTSGVMNSTDGIVVSLDLYRNTFTFKVGYKYQNADGSYGNVTNVVNTTKRYGESYSWSTADISNFNSTIYQAVNYNNDNITTNVDQTVSIDRNTVTVTRQYRTQGTDGNYPSTYASDGTATVLYGASYTYSRTATTEHQAASTTLSNITSAQIISLDVPRNTITVNRQYRAQGTDGNYPTTYTADGTADVLYGATYTYSRSATTSHQAASTTSGVITSSTTISLDVPRKVITINKQYRAQGTDGNYPTTYTADGTADVLYGATYTYSKSATTSHQAASTTSGVITSSTTISLDVPRKTVAVTRQYRAQGTDGNYPTTYTTDGTVDVLYGANYTYSRAATTSHQAASTSLSNVTSAQSISLDVPRKTVAVNIQYRLQGTDGNYPSTYTADGMVNVLYGANYTYSRAATTEHQAASNTITNVTSTQTVSLSVPRNTITVNRQYRAQNTDGNYPTTYTADGTADVLYGATYTYSRSATTSHQAASTTSGVITSSTTISLDVPRKTVTVTKKYRVQDTDGNYPSTYTADGTVNVLYGANYTYSKTATTTHQAASTSLSNVTSAQEISLSVPRNIVVCNKQYKLENADGSWTDYTSDGSVNAYYGGSCSYSKTVTNYRGASNAANGAQGSVTASNVTATQTLSIDFYRNTFTCKISYKYQAANGTYGSATVAVNTTKRYGEACSWSTANITNFNSTAYKAANYTNNSITANVDTTVSIDRNTFTVTKQYKLQDENGNYPSSYTADGTETIRYGDSYTYSKAATTTHQAASKDSGAVTGATTVSLDVPRKLVACNKQYKLENADGSWTAYTSDGSVNAYYGGSCTYSKTVTDYRGASNAVNGAQGSVTASNVTDTQTLSLDFYRNTYTLTVTAGANTSGATGGGAKKWGQAVTVGVTKATNTTCVAYATPTWTATAGTAPAAGASSSYTMPKSNATVTATSAASNINQTITFSTTDATNITLNGNTKTDGQTLDIACGTYNITGTFPSGYDFDSWSATSGTLGSASTLSTTYQVTGPATITLTGKPERCTSRATCMQTITSCPTGVTEVMDARDGTLYKINSLADGRCWMLDNLAIDLVSTPLSSLTGLTNASATSLNYLKNGGGSSSSKYTEDPVEYWTSGGGFTTPKIYMADKDVVPRNAPANGMGSNKVGGYYNYCAASAGSYCYHNYGSSGDATEDICPAGWSMPTRNNINSIVGAYNNVYNNIRNAMSLAVTGYYAHLNGTATGQGSQGEYWTSTLRSSSDDIMYSMHVNSTSEAFESNMVRYQGGTIRCILQVPTYGP